ncbi:MAG: RNA polymerase sigma factor [Acidimicrobiales bacterium]
MFLLRVKRRHKAIQQDLDESEAQLVDRLRNGDEAAFANLVDRYHGSMVRLARGYVPTDAVAEEVAQEAWLGVLRGIRHFQGRSSLRTWVFRIVVNQAKTHGARERRIAADEPLAEPAVEGHRFEGGAWSRPPAQWSHAEERLLATETRGVVRHAIDELPPLQKMVISMRDVDGLGSDEVCRILDLTDGNQRVLLHRARSRVRGALEQYMREDVS